MLKVAMISKWHVHAPEYAGYFAKMEDVQITCVWDEIPIAVGNGRSSWKFRSWRTMMTCLRARTSTR